MCILQRPLPLLKMGDLDLDLQGQIHNFVMNRGVVLNGLNLQGQIHNFFDEPRRGVMSRCAVLLLSMWLFHPFTACVGWNSHMVVFHSQLQFNGWNSRMVEYHPLLQFGSGFIQIGQLEGLKLNLISEDI